ncbi:hypothetical protein NZD89_22950 [Alicyclobacillus fastidiosus]|uniref:DUF5666 domain-containing protein n=1 Tax=Alicyclobacillus fastidiosus TaxID=392011 RepID=A0ABY6ZE38_9BACL|nr:hypothetical protein [Alicyclobacillus fastidiosus]WAH41102.1 hypothetical protein NZD89_22950 [Alicyclobacillus fastidiosus]GMA62657.1 hypothetical protein GCM10025859_30970 [Alicyclobacillus fastidiosus]
MNGKLCALVLTGAILLPISGCGNATNNTVAGGFVGGIGNAIQQGSNAVGNAIGAGNGPVGRDNSTGIAGVVGLSPVRGRVVQVNSANKVLTVQFNDVGRTPNTAGTINHPMHITVPTGWTIRVQGTTPGTISVVANRAAAGVAGGAAGPRQGAATGAAAGTTQAGSVTGAPYSGRNTPGADAIGGGTGGRGITRGAAGGTAAGASGAIIGGGGAGTGTGGTLTPTAPANGLGAVSDRSVRRVFRATKPGQYMIVSTGRNRIPQTFCTITVSNSVKVPSVSSRGSTH